METSERKKATKRIEGRVVSSKMDKTIVVRTVTKIKHKMLGKYLVKRFKVRAHDQNNDANEGDKVMVEELSRPLSKTKRWVLKKIVEKAQ